MQAYNLTRKKPDTVNTVFILLSFNAKKLLFLLLQNCILLIIDLDKKSKTIQAIYKRGGF